MRLEGRCAIVTGATQGIGLATTQRLLDEGARVVMVARNRERCEGVVAELGEERVAFVAASIDDAGTAAAAVTLAQERFGPLDILVNNAGMDYTSDLLTTPMADVELVFAVNFFGALRMLQAAALAMAGRGGSIVNVTSQQANVYVDSLAVYGASKAALQTLTRGAAVELAPQRIRVNAVAPGLTDTPMITTWVDDQADPVAFRAAEAARIPIGRLIDPGEVAAAIAYLASDEAASVTGASLAVDGGYTAR
ncbi:MAG TPA: glucose 1-dehydrogenase [Baekduia sp.]|uniref:SDR family NAD(P)-dependent oxidoreductase n=1 Tax=Baekduia sp. TaxID=2600305 RepID=UPI002B71D18A|nr:glucose 1-dehydrogenase [Baekduia sp.]HMJ34478.1 glucose 1-dehydrogenase [Baekduia sp.]